MNSKNTALITTSPTAKQRAMPKRLSWTNPPAEKRQSIHERVSQPGDGGAAQQYRTPSWLPCEVRESKLPHQRRIPCEAQHRHIGAIIGSVAHQLLLHLQGCSSFVEKGAIGVAECVPPDLPDSESFAGRSNVVLADLAAVIWLACCRTGK